MTYRIKNNYPFARIALALFAISSISLAQSAIPKETPMTLHATGPFDVKMIPQDDKSVDGASRFLIDKQYHGELEGVAKGQMLTNGVDANGSGVYIAIEKFTGTLHGRSGSFVLHHTGIMNRGKPDLTIMVAPDSGTGQLAGIAGKMTINIAAGKHSYDFEYTLPKTD